ncbi:MAG: FAD-binding oxidoreductase, partial [Armatimonadetes bacterium]|nr:FAD-binding oxidoreductase [Armatimonadota bacterium]
MSRIIIVGAGIIGLSCAYELSKDGHEIIVIDDQLEDFRRCSWGNAGVVVPSHFIPLAAPGVLSAGMKMLARRDSPFGFKFPPSRQLSAWMTEFGLNANQQNVDQFAKFILDLNLASREIFTEWSKELPDFGFAQKGLWILCQSEKTLEHERETARKANALNLETREIVRKEFEKETNVPSEVLGAIHYPCDAHLNPILLLPHLIDALRNAGVEFHFQTKVTQIDSESVIANGEQLFGDRIIVCAGAQTPSLLKQQLPKFKQVGGKGYSFQIPFEDLPLPAPILLVDARVAITPMGDFTRIAGTMELGANLDGINEDRIRGIKESVISHFPQTEKVVREANDIWA